MKRTLSVGPNQYVDRLWLRISEAYPICKPSGTKPRTSEQCRKQWLRLRPKLSRFAALYQNNMRMVSSGMSEDDVRRQTFSQYPSKELGIKEFDQWEAFLVVKDSQKFAVGVESGWKRTKINSSGEYSSSAGSHELPEAEEVAPLPRTDTRRRRRPMGQQAAQRMARGSGSGSGSGSYEVESEVPAGEDDDSLARAQQTKTLMQITLKWYNTHDPVLRRLCKEMVDQCRRDLRIPPIDDDGVEIGGGDVGGGSGTGDGDEDEEEE